MARKHGKLYDWDGWFGAGRVVLRRGRDYRCSTGSLVQQARNAASHRGLSLTVVEDEDKGIVTILVNDAVQNAAGG